MSVYARRRIAALLSLGAATLLILAFALRSGGKASPPSPGPAAKTKTRTVVRPPAVEAGLLPWQLAAPLSREVVVPRAGTRELVLLGGLDSQGSSVSTAYRLDTHSGTLTPNGTLVRATHDAAGALLGTRVLVVGGGASSVFSSTQIETGSSTTPGGALPQPRADASAVAIGSTVYVVGGYSGGRKMDPAVLATTDGRTYRTVATLPVGVRYPAVAALGSQIYVFGGLEANGRPGNTVQVVDPAAHKASVVGHTPVPLAGSSAGVLGGTIYLAGGLTGTRATSRIYAFEPQGSKFLAAGTLRVPVANAGATVSRGRLWIVGGETGGSTPTAAVQMVVPNRRFGNGR